MKKNLILIIAFALPVVFILAVALMAYLPGVFVSTDYDFLYATCDDTNRYYNYFDCDNYLKQKYRVVDGKLVENADVEIALSNLDVQPPSNAKTSKISNYVSRIFLYNTTENESKEITLETAQTLSLDNLLTSPDGVTVSSSYDRSVGVFPLFDSRSSYGYYLTEGGHKKKLNLINNSDRYRQDNFHFIGWVLSTQE